MKTVFKGLSACFNCLDLLKNELVTFSVAFTFINRGLLSSRAFPSLKASLMLLNSLSSQRTVAIEFTAPEQFDTKLPFPFGFPSG